jgi:hypothetical protein
MYLAIVCGLSAKRETEREKLATVRFEIRGYGVMSQFVASYAHGKQKRTKTRKEKAEARKTEAWKLRATCSADRYGTPEGSLTVCPRVGDTVDEQWLEG